MFLTPEPLFLCGYYMCYPHVDAWQRAVDCGGFFTILFLILMQEGVSCFIHLSIRSLNTCTGLACCRCWEHLPAGSRSGEQDRRGRWCLGSVGRDRQQALQEDTRRAPPIGWEWLFW